MRRHEVALDLVEVGGHVLARRALVLVGQLGDALGEVVERGGQRRQLGGVERPSSQCGAVRNGFRAPSGPHVPCSGCCSGSTSAGWTATCAVACPARPPRSSRPSTRCGRCSPTCASAATSRCASSPLASTAPRSTTCGCRRPTSPRRVEEIAPDVRAALEVAHANITAYHEAQRHADAEHRNGRITVRELQRPVDRAACYVPSALAPLVSTVLMTAVPAKVAGVPEVVLVTSPQRDGTVAPGILAAAAIAGVDEVYRVGGPAVIGALAYGTESIRPVDVIVGPGSARVAQAKREVASAGLVGVPSAFAGPVRGRRGRRRVHAGRVGRHRRRAPGRARPRRPGLAHHLGRGGGRRRRRGRRRDRAALAAPRSTSRPPWPRAATRCCATGPSRPSRSPTPSPPSTSSCSSTDPDALLPARAPRRRGVLRARTRRRRSATTSPAPTTCCPPTARPASRARCGSTTSSSTSTSCPSTRPPSPRSASTSIALATYEGLDAHAESIRLRQDRS